MRTRTWAAVCLAVAAGLICGRANAATFNFDFEGINGGPSLIGTFTADPDGANYHVTGLSGIFDPGGQGAGPLVAGGPGVFTTPAGLYNVDNIYYPNGGQGGLLDIYGLGFYINGAEANLWGNGAGQPYTLSIYALNYDPGYAGGLSVEGNLVFAAAVASTPLPGALPLFAGGLGLAGLMMGRRKAQKVNLPA